MRALCLVALGFALVACRDRESGSPDAMPDSDGFPYPPPRTDVIAPLGSADTLEIAAWNIENFPAIGSTPSRVADLIASLDLDIIVVEEIASVTAWTELLERLRDHDGILSEHRYSETEYQKIGVIYRASMVTPSMIEYLFPDDTYAFPRPPYSAQLAIDDGAHRALSLRVIGVHLKAGVTPEDGARRLAAFESLDTHVRERIGAGDESEIVIAGDYNEVVNTTSGQTNMAALLGAPELYTVQTKALAASGAISFVPNPRLIDHITTTAALAEETVGSQLVIPTLHMLPGYVSEVSDHLPVVLITPLAPR